MLENPVDMQDNWTTDANSSNYTPRYIPQKFPIEYRIIATTIHSFVFIVGVLGNIAVVVVVRKSRSLHTPTYCYLVSLAIADLLVLLSAMPEAIVSYHLYARQWVLGRAGCSLLIFGNFLGINASSISILCFTVERYIGICKPLLAHKVCSLERAKRIILATWMFAVLYSSPWLGLTKTTSVVYNGPTVVEHCGFRLQPQTYSYVFMTDLVLFYMMPLVVSSALYVKIGFTLKRSQLLAMDPAPTTPLQANGNSKKYNGRQSVRRHTCRPDAEKDAQMLQVVRMLLTIVALFAILWLPYRGLLVYNSMTSRPWLNIWYLLFAKTAIFVNSAINPVMYNAMSLRFRRAFIRHIFPCWIKLGSEQSEASWTRSIPILTYSSSGYFTPRNSVYGRSPRGSMLSLRSTDDSLSFAATGRRSRRQSSLHSSKRSLQPNTPNRTSPRTNGSETSQFLSPPLNLPP